MRFFFCRGTFSINNNLSVWRWLCIFLKGIHNVVDNFFWSFIRPCHFRGTPLPEYEHTSSTLGLHSSCSIRPRQAKPTSCNWKLELCGSCMLVLSCCYYYMYLPVLYMQMLVAGGKNISNSSCDFSRNSQKCWEYLGF